jgi:exosortase A
MREGGIIPPSWRLPLPLLAVLWLGLLGLYGATAAAMATVWWRSDTYAHGMVVPLVSLWLAWRVRQRVLRVTPAPAASAWLLMGGAAALWLAGDLMAVNPATQFALVALLVLAVPAVLGWEAARPLAFPLGFLFLAVPLGDFMLPTMMEWTADFTVAAVRLSGIPVYREGLQFVIPSGRWSVVEACSGVRYMIASITVGCLFAHLSYHSWRKRLVFMLAAFIVPLVGNWMRAYLIVMLGHLSGNKLATGVDHLVYGWLFFGLLMMVLLWVGARWADPVHPADSRAAGGGAQPLLSSGPFVRAVLAAGLVAMVPHGLASQFQRGVGSESVALSALPPHGSWVAGQPPSSWAPSYQAANAAAHLGFESATGSAVGLHLAYFRHQDQERKLVSSENVLVRSSDTDWVRVRSETTAAELARSGVAVTSTVLRSADGKQGLLVWQFFWVNGHLTASPLQAKLFGALELVRGRGDDGAIVALYTPLLPGPTGSLDAEAAGQLLRDFLRSQGDELLASLQRTREGG